MDELKGAHRTRSRASPDWTLEESLILVNEITAVESEWGTTLPSFQKWQQIVENSNALDVRRNLNQCKRKWNAMLSDYARVKHGSTAAAADHRSFPLELFKAIEICLESNGRRNDGGEMDAVESDAAEMDEELDSDSDPDAQGRVTKKFFETGSKKQIRTMKRNKRRLKTLNPWGYITSQKTMHEKSNSVDENVTNTGNTIESLRKESNFETKEQIMATTLHENAVQINAILEGNLTNDKPVDLKNDEVVQIDFTRHQGDKLIDCLQTISVTLNQLCDLVQQCK